MSAAPDLRSPAPVPESAVSCYDPERRTCNGRWSECPNAYPSLIAEGPMRGAPIMLCRITGKHPDECGK